MLIGLFISIIAVWLTVVVEGLIILRNIYSNHLKLKKIMSEQTDAAAKLEAIVARLNAAEVLLKAIIAAAKTAGSLDPALAAAINDADTATSAVEGDEAGA